MDGKPDKSKRCILSGLPSAGGKEGLFAWLHGKMGLPGYSVPPGPCQTHARGIFRWGTAREDLRVLSAFCRTGGNALRHTLVDFRAISPRVMQTLSKPPCREGHGNFIRFPAIPVFAKKMNYCGISGLCQGGRLGFSGKSNCFIKPPCAEFLEFANFLQGGALRISSKILQFCKVPANCLLCAISNFCEIPLCRIRGFPFILQGGTLRTPSKIQEILPGGTLRISWKIQLFHKPPLRRILRILLAFCKGRP